MLIVGTNGQRNVRIGENWQVAIRFGCYSSTLDVLVIAISNVYWRITSRFEKLSTRMLVEHAFTKSSKLFPLVSPVL